MAGIMTQRLSSPGKTRTPEKTKVDVVAQGAAKAARFTMTRGVAVVGLHQTGGRPFESLDGWRPRVERICFSKRPPWNLSLKEPMATRRAGELPT